MSRVRENRMHGSTGGDWKRNAPASPRQSPTQPTTALADARADPEWRASIQQMLDHPDLHATPRPVIYEVVLDVHPDDLL